jgi:hypothetical protein
LVTTNKKKRIEKKPNQKKRIEKKTQKKKKNAYLICVCGFFQPHPSTHTEFFLMSSFDNNKNDSDDDEGSILHTASAWTARSSDNSIMSLIAGDVQVYEDDDNDYSFGYNNYYINKNKDRENEEKEFIQKFGQVKYGIRQPCAKVPVWVTLSINSLGFPENKFRARLEEPGKNQAYLSENGIRDLAIMYNTGAYVVKIPEHCALLCFAALIQAGKEVSTLCLGYILCPKTCL